MSRIQVETSPEAMAKEDLLDALMIISTEAEQFTDKLTYVDGPIDK